MNIQDYVAVTVMAAVWIIMQILKKPVFEKLNLTDYIPLFSALLGVVFVFWINGAMATGWIKIKEKWYYLDDNGKMVTGWIHWKNNWYYCDQNGEMAVGEHPVLAYFNESGALERKK